MKTTMIAYLVRHTPVQVAAGTCYGQSDVPLVNSYGDDMQAIAHKLDTSAITFCSTSPLQRCTTLAKDLCPNLSAHTDVRLLELNFGDWELQRWDDLGEDAAYWGDHFVATQCPNGESFTQLYDRVTVYWQNLCKEHPDDTVLITAHAGPIRSIIASISDIPLEDIFSLQIDYGGVTKIEVSPTTQTVAYINR